MIVRDRPRPSLIKIVLERPSSLSVLERPRASLVVVGRRWSSLVVVGRPSSSLLVLRRLCRHLSSSFFIFLHLPFIFRSSSVHLPFIFLRRLSVVVLHSSPSFINQETKKSVEAVIQSVSASCLFADRSIDRSIDDQQRTTTAGGWRTAAEIINPSIHQKPSICIQAHTPTHPPTHSLSIYRNLQTRVEERTPLTLTACHVNSNSDSVLWIDHTCAI